MQRQSFYLFELFIDSSFVIFLFILNKMRFIYMYIRPMLMHNNKNNFWELILLIKLLITF